MATELFNNVFRTAGLAVVVLLALLPAGFAQSRPLFIVNSGTGTITRDWYLHNGTGDYVGSMRQPAVSSGPGAFKGAITADGRWLYVANRDGQSVSAYSVGDYHEGLSPVVGQPFTTGNGSPESIAVTPDSRFAYVPVSTPTGGSVAAFRIAGNSGVLTRLADSSFGSGAHPRTATVSPDGRHLYVAGGNGVSAYGINPSTGTLSAVETALGVTDATDATIRPEGDFLYVLGAAGVSVYRRDPGGGALTPVLGQPFASGSAPSALAITPDGSKLYVGDSASESVFLHSIDPATGALAPTGGQRFMRAGTPGAMTILPNGRFLLIASDWYGTGYLILFKIGAGSGELEGPFGPPESAGPDPTDVILQPANGPISDLNVVNPGIAGKTPTLLRAATDDGGPPPLPPTEEIRYSWELGEASKHLAHIDSPLRSSTYMYASPGTHTVSLRVENGEGCPGIIFTGRTPYCGSSSVSKTTKPIHVPGELNLQLQASSQRLNRKRGIVAYAKCAGDGCNVSLDGSFTMKQRIGKKRRSHAKSAAKFKVKSVQATAATSSALASDSRTRIKLKFTARGYRALAHQLRSSKRVQLKIAGTAVAGQQSTKATVRLDLTKPAKSHKPRR